MNSGSFLFFFLFKNQGEFDIIRFKCIETKMQSACRGQAQSGFEPGAATWYLGADELFGLWKLLLPQRLPILKLFGSNKQQKISDKT